MKLLTFIGEHPVVSIILLLIILEGFVEIVKAIKS
jgi:hypothetical protein